MLSFVRFLPHGSFGLTAALAVAVAACPLSGAAPRPSPDAHAEKSKPAKQEVHAITEEELKRQLAGKTFFLRSGYLDNELRFNKQGNFVGTSPKVSYTLSLVEIEHVHLSKSKLELEGVRYGLHFLGAGPGEDIMEASDKVRITPKKKSLRIIIYIAKVDGSKSKSAKSSHGKTKSEPPPQPLNPNASLTDSAGAGAPDVQDGEAVTQAQANQLLREALDHVFSQGIDDRLIASLPDYWQLYYRAAARKVDYLPSDPSVFRQNAVDQKARLLTMFDAPSNDFAQNAGVVGVALYHVVVSRDGKPAEIAVGRPIGFGLDEGAVEAIRKASFQPAIKDGKPVPVVLDLVVQFRIYSKRTEAGSETASSGRKEPDEPKLPGPYTANQPPAQPQQ